MTAQPEPQYPVTEPPGDHLVSLLSRIGWSQRELARKLGIDHSAVWRYVRGEGNYAPLSPAQIEWLECLAFWLEDHPAPPRR